MESAPDLFDDADLSEPVAHTVRRIAIAGFQALSGLMHAGCGGGNRWWFRRRGLSAIGRRRRQDLLLSPVVARLVAAEAMIERHFGGLAALTSHSWKALPAQTSASLWTRSLIWSKGGVAREFTRRRWYVPSIGTGSDRVGC